MDIFPLFASNLVVLSLSEDLSIFSDQIKNLNYHNSKISGSKDSLASNNLKVLKNYPNIENIILDNFKKYSSEVLKLEVNFIISTSWITKVEKGNYSHLHSHKNSFYSGVLYFDDYIEGEVGEIEFHSPIMSHTDFLITPKEYNICNSFSWSISPQKNFLIFFPSYLQHRITQHNSENPRYSLAFNIVPVGEYGIGDSFSNVVWNY